MAIGGDDRVVRVDADTLIRLKTLQGELTASTGLKFRIGDVVRRATQALAAAHNAGAWLSPAESAPLFERRHREAIISAAAQAPNGPEPLQPRRGRMKTVVTAPAAQAIGSTKQLQAQAVLAFTEFRQLARRTVE